MGRLIAAEFRKLVTTRLWLWLLLASVAWTAGYSALAIALGQRPGGLTPPLPTAAGQHALFAIGAGGAGPLAAILAAAGVAGEFRHRGRDVPGRAAPGSSRPSWSPTCWPAPGTPWPAWWPAPPSRCRGCKPGEYRYPAWVAALAGAGAIATARRDIT